MYSCTLLPGSRKVVVRRDDVDAPAGASSALGRKRKRKSISGRSPTLNAGIDTRRGKKGSLLLNAEELNRKITIWRNLRRNSDNCPRGTKGRNLINEKSGPGKLV